MRLAVGFRTTRLAFFFDIADFGPTYILGLAPGGSKSHVESFAFVPWGTTMSLVRVRPFVAHLARRSAGFSGAEYAVCMGAVVIVVLIGLSYLGTSVRNTFSNSAMLAKAPATGAMAHGGESARADGSQSTATAAAPGLGLAVLLPVGIAAAGLCLSAGWIGCRLVRRTPKDIADAAAAAVPKELQHKFASKRQAILNYLSADSQQLAQGQMSVRHVMSTEMLTKRPDDDVEATRKLMNESFIRHLVVCSPDGTILGVLSDRDINAREGQRVGDIMTLNPVMVTPDTPVNTVSTIMLTRRINCVPVVEENRVVGIVTTSDLIDGAAVRAAVDRATGGASRCGRTGAACRRIARPRGCGLLIAADPERLRQRRSTCDDTCVDKLAPRAALARR